MELNGLNVKTDDVGKIHFFYPDFVIKDELTFSDLDNKIIWVGKKKDKEWLERNTKDFINTTGIPDLVFDRESWVDLALVRAKARNSKSNILKSAEDLDDEDFFNHLKIFTVTKKWELKYDESETIYNLFKALVSSRGEAIQFYFRLIDNYPPAIIESSLLTFLVRVKNINEQNVSPEYMRLLKQANQVMKDKIKGAVMNLSRSTVLRDELSMLNLITDLR